MSFADFREIQPETRAVMAQKCPHSFEKLVETSKNFKGPVWVKIKDWRGALDHLAPQMPCGAGQIIRRAELAKRARIE